MSVVHIEKVLTSSMSQPQWWVIYMFDHSARFGLLFFEKCEDRRFYSITPGIEVSWKLSNQRIFKYFCYWFFITAVVLFYFYCRIIKCPFQCVTYWFSGKHFYSAWKIMYSNFPILANSHFLHHWYSIDRCYSVGEFMPLIYLGLPSHDLQRR